MSEMFSELGLISELVDACKSVGYKEPTEIQKKAIPIALEGRDIIGLSKTGSGKTAAFVLPILHHLWKQPSPFYAVILAPTRELAFQIGEQCTALGSTIGVRCTVLVGGVDMTQQKIALSRKPHIVVATPGRMADHLENTKGFSLKSAKYLVLDEADRLLDSDYGPKIDLIMRCIPKERRTMLFSATMTSKVHKLQRACLDNPAKIEVNSKYETVDTLMQYYLFFPLKFKDCYLVYLMNEFSGNSCIVFTATCAATTKVSLMLRNLGLNGAVPLHGQMSQQKRLASLNKFKSGNKNILICTDVASRGLDIPQVGYVINYDVPLSSKNYLHRIGRTARAGRHGKTITFVTQYDVEVYQRIENAISKKLDKYELDDNAVKILMDSVDEANHMASQQMKDLANKKKKNKPEEDAEDTLHQVKSIKQKRK
eukprot:NODE_36_length_31474_cov_0.342438.p7 type:complete len:426 gc:universal NODE_36_length_31474_cov_0.342438:19102-17825(-)